MFRGFDLLLSVHRFFLLFFSSKLKMDDPPGFSLNCTVAIGLYVCIFLGRYNFSAGSFVFLNRIAYGFSNAPPPSKSFRFNSPLPLSNGFDWPSPSFHPIM